MPRQLQTGRGVQWVLRAAKQDHSLRLDLGYDKVKREWNCWAYGEDYYIGRGSTPEATYHNFLAVNRLKTEKQS